MRCLMVKIWNLNILKKNNYLALAFSAFIWMNHSIVLAQSDSISIEESVQQVSLDPFANLYLLTTNNEFKKYNEKGVFQQSYSDLKLSDLSEISSDHPFKSMIYYPEYDLIRVFGNKLQILAELNLSQYGFGEITAVAPSTGYQSFWLFDATNQQLVKINQQYGIEIKSDELSRFTQHPFFPKIIKEREGWIYTYDADNGLFIFDSFGTFSAHIEIKDAYTFSVFNQKIFIYKEEGLYEVEPILQTIKPLEVKVDGKILELAFRKIVVEKNGVLKIVKF